MEKRRKSVLFGYSIKSIIVLVLSLLFFVHLFKNWDAFKLLVSNFLATYN